MKVGALNLPRDDGDESDGFPSFFDKFPHNWLKLGVTTPIPQDVEELLKNDPRVRGLEGKLLSTGIGWGTAGGQVLRGWFVWFANEHGTDAARATLEHYLDATEVRVKIALWVLGVQVKERLALGDGCELVPLEEMPQSLERYYFKSGAARNEIPGPWRTLPRTAITISISVLKILGDSIEASPDTPTILDCQRQLYDVCYLLNALPGVSCAPYYLCGYTDHALPKGPYSGSSGSWPLFDVQTHGAKEVSREALDSLPALRVGFDKLSASEKKRFKLVLGRLSQAKRRREIENKILDLGIALEMMLLEDNPNNEQLSLQFRLRGSWLVGDVASRRGKYDLLKEIYNYRSDVAHGGVLCKGNEPKIMAVAEKFGAYEKLAESICQQLIIGGKPDWNLVVLGLRPDR